jgi:hypothetical protein
MSKSKSADRMTPAVIAAQQARRTEAQEMAKKIGGLKKQVPDMDAYLLIANPSTAQQRTQVAALTTALLALTRGTVSGA